MSSNEKHEQQVETSSNAKRIIGIAVITTVVAGLTFLSGCGSNATSNPSTNPPPTPAATPKVITDPPPIIVKSGSIHFESEGNVDDKKDSVKTEGEFAIGRVRITAFNLGLGKVTNTPVTQDTASISVTLQEFVEMTPGKWDWSTINTDLKIVQDGKYLKMTSPVELDSKKVKPQHRRKYHVEDKTKPNNDKEKILRIFKVTVGSTTITVGEGEELSIAIYKL